MGYLHHIVVGIPMALVISAAGLLVLSCVVSWPALRRASEVALVLGTALGLLAVLTGVLAQAGLQVRDHEALAAHRALTLVGLGVAVAACALWMTGVRVHLLHARLFRWGVPLLAVAAAVLIGWGARRGGVIAPGGRSEDVPAAPRTVPQDGAGLERARPGR